MRCSFGRCAFCLAFERFLPDLDAREPTSREEVGFVPDLEFYESFGSEDATRRCRNAACSRGAISLGVFCPKHHFEMLMQRPCAFDH